MTDKEQFKAEIEKVKLIIRSNRAQGAFAEEYLIGQESVFEHFENFVNSMQEEPVSIWHDASKEPKPNMELICVGQYGNPLVLSSNSNSFKSRDISKWAYFNDLLNLSNVQRTVKNWKEEPVSEDLEEAVLKGLKSVHLEMGELTRNCYGLKWKQAWKLVNAAIQSVENFEVMNV